MPEGNELHRWAKLHTETFVGTRVRVDSPQGRFAEDAALLDGKVLRRVYAVGKHLRYDFGAASRPRILHVHMGLYGKFTQGVAAKHPMPEPRGALRMRLWNKHDWLELRGPTNCAMWTEAHWAKLLTRLGPDPINRDDPTKMYARIAKRRTPIATLLMDQAILAGVGNIYRAELLFRARLSPFRPGAEVPLPALEALWADACALMPEGMVDRRIVTTRPEDRPHPRGRALGEEAHYVYRRQGRPCFVCGTLVKTLDLGGRNLFWCPGCQRA